MAVLKIAEGHPPIIWFGEPRNSDYALQEGEIFCWSESNVRYESVWWLNADGTPYQVPKEEANAFQRQQHIDNILLDRPFDPLWLQGVR